MRNYFSLGWPLLYDLQWHFVAAAVMLMAAYTLQRNEHVRVDVLASRLGKRGMAWVDLVGTVLVLIPLCLVVAWVTLPPFWHSLTAGETRASRDNMSRAQERVGTRERRQRGNSDAAREGMRRAAAVTTL